MDNYQAGIFNWVASNPAIIDYNNLLTSSAAPQSNTIPFWNGPVIQNQPLLQPLNIPADAALGAWNPVTSTHNTNPVGQLYNPFVQDDVDEMDISDDEKYAKKFASTNAKPQSFSTIQPTSLKKKLEIKSGAAFYQGLILYIPDFEQITNSYKGSPAMKMLYASFEFSFKIPLKIEIKKMANIVQLEASVTFKDHVLVKTTNTVLAAQNEVCVRALELLSETCYTIQAKESYFQACKLIDSAEMKTLNLKKWETVSKKYPKLQEVAKDSHIQKTFSVLLDNHLNTGMYEDIICCNLTRQDVMDIKRVVEFFQLTLLPCCLTTNLTKKNTPYVVSIHKYTSARQLLEILMETGGENDKFKLYSPDTFKDFYKLHHSFWDSTLQKSDRNPILQSKTTLDDVELQSAIMKPYENVVAEIFEKHKLLPKLNNQSDDSEIRQAGDDFIKDTLKIDMAHSKTVAPVERMELLLNYMGQLQEYGSQVLASGRHEMIKIYHNAIDNLRKDLDKCRKDIEKEQKDKMVQKEGGEMESCQNKKSKSPGRRTNNEYSRRRSVSPRSWSPKKSEKRRSASPRKRLSRSKSPGRRNNNEYSRRRSVSPKNKPRSRSPKKSEKRRSASPRKRLSRSKSPERRNNNEYPRRRSVSPRNRPRSRSPKKFEKRRSASPRKRLSRSKSPGRRNDNEYSRRSVSPRNRPRPRSPKKSEKRRSASPRKRPKSKSPRRSGRTRDSPHRQTRTPPKKLSPVRRPKSRSQSPQKSKNDETVLETIFKDQFRRFVVMLRKFRTEIEDTPIERRGRLRDKMIKYQEVLHKFYSDTMNNQRELGSYLNEIKICQDEIDEQVQLVAGKPRPSDLPRSLTPSSSTNVQNFEPVRQYSSYGLSRPSLLGAPTQPPTALFGEGVRPLEDVFPVKYPISLPPKYKIN